MWLTAVAGYGNGFSLLHLLLGRLIARNPLRHLIRLAALYLPVKRIEMSIRITP